MAHFIVTFRIKNDSTYQDRYESFVGKAKVFAKYSPWDQTTSFLTFESKEATLSASSLCSRLYTGSKFDSAKDVMVVIDLDNKQKATKGEIEYEPLLTGGLGF